MLRLLLAALVAAPLCAQTLRVRNQGNTPWRGWLEVLCPAMSPTTSAWHPATHMPLLVVDGDDGEEAIHHVYAEVPPWSDMTVSGLQPCVRPVLRLPDDPTVAWGGMPTVSGQPLAWRLQYIGGCAAYVRADAIVGQAHVAMSFWWYPDQPWIVTETRVLGAGPGWTLPADMVLAWGNGVWTHPVLLPAGSLVPVDAPIVTRRTVYWPALFREPADLDRAWAAQLGTVRLEQM
jgi:hypothetical protein